ncbi:MAG: aspartate-semialdehyde dehydrogenase [Fimbriimonadaceae bacterium]|nr:aspartate-semialdehyde dehydrogenase [Fimbriimonadaceae bacterium]QYK54845.1 MAG: aspartate-semialdehyde dehydrogenase [Fimbriimonadaceae bacterium]
MDVAVLGVTGAVGREFLELFERRRFPLRRLVPLASARSAGSKVTCAGQEWTVQEPSAEAFRGIDVGFFSAGASRSREWAPVAVGEGATIVDNSSAFRMEPDVPLVVPEVNFCAIPDGCRLIANPNCCTIVLLMAVAPLCQLGQVQRLVVSTYQSASGGGAAMMEDLVSQTRRSLDGVDSTPSFTRHPYAFNLFSHDSAVRPDGENEEEAKIVAETQKILGRPDLGVNVTCVRVPVLRAHTESVTVEFAEPGPTEDQVRECLQNAPGVRIVDDRERNHFPMPVEASGIDEVLVGRIRRDPSHPSAMRFLVSGDQLLKGAALNAVQIAERLLAEGRLRSGALSGQGS